MNDEDDSDDFTDPQVQRAAEEIRANWKRLAAVVDPDLLATAEDVVYYRGPWRLHGGYVVRTDADGRETRLHRLITGAPEDQYVDHANRNRADNRRENLRVCTPAQNSENKTLSRRNTSGVTGVTCHKTRAREGRQSWSARYKGKHLGWFDTKEGASAARLKAEAVSEFSPSRSNETARERESRRRLEEAERRGALVLASFQPPRGGWYNPTKEELARFAEEWRDACAREKEQLPQTPVATQASAAEATFRELQVVVEHGTPAEKAAADEKLTLLMQAALASDWRHR